MQRKSQTNNYSEFSEQNVPSKIVGGKKMEKFNMDVISLYIINTPPNVSSSGNIWMFDKNTQALIISCAMYLCIILYISCFNQIEIPLQISMGYIFRKNWPSFKLQTCSNFMKIYASMDIWQCFIHINKFQVLNNNQIIIKMYKGQLNHNSPTVWAGQRFNPADSK